MEKKSFFRFYLIRNNSKKNRNWISYYWQYHHVVFICLGIVTSSSWLLRKRIEIKVVRLLDNQCSGFTVNIAFQKNSNGFVAILFFLGVITTFNLLFLCSLKKTQHKGKERKYWSGKEFPTDFAKATTFTTCQRQIWKISVKFWHEEFGSLGSKFCEGGWWVGNLIGEMIFWLLLATKYIELWDGKKVGRLLK